MRLDHLFEAKAASLYHATAFSNAVHIITENMFGAKTEHTLPHLGPVKGVSFTRNFQFAISWSNVVFELDRARLMHRYRLWPYNYWQNPSEKSRSEARQEAEEFVVGSITPASRYITAIHIRGRYLEPRMAAVYHLEDAFFDPLRQNPLLKVHSIP